MTKFRILTNKKSGKSISVVFFTTLLALVIAPFLVANSVDDVALPSAEEISSASQKLLAIEAVATNKAENISLDLAQEIAEARRLIDAAKAAIADEQEAADKVEDAETALVEAEALVFDEAAYDTAIDSAEELLRTAQENRQGAVGELIKGAESALDFAQKAIDNYGTYAAKVATCTKTFLSACTKTDGTYSVVEVNAAMTAKAMLDAAGGKDALQAEVDKYQKQLDPNDLNYIGNTIETSLAEAVNTAQTALEQAKTAKQTAVTNFDTNKENAINTAKSDLIKAEEALAAATQAKNKALEAVIPVIEKINDGSLLKQIEQEVYTNTLAIITPDQDDYKYLSHTVLKNDNLSNIEFQEPFRWKDCSLEDEDCSKEPKIIQEIDGADIWLNSVHVNAEKLTEGVYNFVLEYCVKGFPYLVTYELIIPSQFEQEFAAQMKRLQENNLNDLADIYKELWQGETSVAGAIKGIYPDKAADIDSVISTLKGFQDKPVIGSAATEILRSLEKPLTKDQIINGLTIDLPAGQKLSLGNLAQVVDAAIAGAGLDIGEISKAVDDTIEAGQLLTNLADSVGDLTGFLRTADYNNLDSVQAINNYLQTAAAKYSAVDTALGAIKTARDAGNKVLSDDSYLRSIAEMVAEVLEVDLDEFVAEASDLLSGLLASGLVDYGVDTESQSQLYDLLNQLNKQIADSETYTSFSQKLKNFKFDDVVSVSNQLNSWLARVAEISAKIASYAEEIGVDDLQDLKNYAIKQIDQAKNRLVEWAADNRDPFLAAIKTAAVQAVNRQLDNLKQLIVGSSTYADLLTLIDDIKQVAAAAEAIIKTAQADYQVVEPYAQAAIDFANYLADFENRLKDVRSIEAAAALMHELASNYSQLNDEFAKLTALSADAQTVVNWALGLSDDALLAVLPHIERVLINHAAAQTKNPLLNQIIDNLISSSVRAVFDEIVSTISDSGDPSLDSLIAWSARVSSDLDSAAGWLDQLVALKDRAVNEAASAFEISKAKLEKLVDKYQALKAVAENYADSDEGRAIVELLDSQITKLRQLIDQTDWDQLSDEAKLAVYYALINSDEILAEIYGQLADIKNLSKDDVEKLAFDLLDYVVEFINSRQIFEFSGGETIILSETDRTFEINVQYSEQFLAIINKINQVLAKTGSEQVDLPAIDLPQLSLTPLGLDSRLSYDYPTLGTLADFTQLTEDIVIEKQAFELTVLKPVSEAFEQVGLKLGRKTYNIEIVMPRCQIAGKTDLNLHNPNCDSPTDGSQTGGTENNNTGDGGGSAGAPAGLAAGNISLPRTAYRGLSADNSDESPTVASPTETNTPKATEPQGEFVSIPIKRSNWSLLAVILTALTLVISIVKLIGLRDHFTDKSNAIFRILTIVPATAAIVVLILLSDFNTPMAIADINSLPIIGILIVQIVLAVKSPHSEVE
ncbi:MAG: hypothetical protein LBU20_00930 [Candidatus Nomurabacteria bacterium]|jgi:hypothetical protein|nr:hypothetical protein [Candidatus Nomurabacteria bacterium]